MNQSKVEWTVFDPAFGSGGFLTKAVIEIEKSIKRSITAQAFAEHKADFTRFNAILSNLKTNL